MSQVIQVAISGSFPGYQIAFSAEPTAVPFGKVEQITYALATSGFSLVGANVQRDPFSSADELTWVVPTGGQSLTFSDNNCDAKQTAFGVELVFTDKAGNRFSSIDPVIINEGEE